tara:strand:- start:237 stop:1118 length:882 start_codon:yes stop_codon:yes gene_type:complete
LSSFFGGAVTMICIQQIENSSDSKVLDFLNRFEETSQFLINNLSTYGPRLTDHHNSGNFKAILKNEEIIGVFCLSLRGNLLIQTSEPLASKLIAEDCGKESHLIKGLIGDWNSVAPLFEYLKKSNSDFAPTLIEKEVLYRLDLKSEHQNLVKDQRVRFLNENDFDPWLVQSKLYNEELNLPNPLSEDQIRHSFNEAVLRKMWWGLFENSRLLSRAGLNSSGNKVGQVGGVFTPHEYRKQGLAKSTMLHMLCDCRDHFGHYKSILFTGESDVAARKLYESIGYSHIGYFGLILS